MEATDAIALPEWEVSQWFNTSQPIRVADLRGQVVLVHAFQMLCPGCVSHAIPQARRVHELFADQGVAVIGLHTVFEHHSAMQSHALEAFLYEYKVRFPVGIDAPSDDGQPIPRTMAKLDLRSTPSTLMLDRQGKLRLQHFGHLDDLLTGVVLGQLLAETADIAS
ncbi:MAG: redoxin domain-containing protein [Brachymonas sp.]|nr:redoxin domain-containing protein [Brachymonas sp.]